MARQRDLGKSLLGWCEFSSVGTEEGMLYFPTADVGGDDVASAGGGGLGVEWKEHERMGRPQLWDQTIWPPITFFLEDKGGNPFVSVNC